MHLFKTTDGYILVQHYLFFSMNVDDYMHSDNVLFYNLGLGSKNNITEKEWNIMTLSAILSKLGHTEVCVLIY